MDAVKQVLIIENDLETQSIYSNYLSSAFDEDIQIIKKSTGAEGLHYLEKNKVDCILLDDELPDMNGLDLLKKISNTTCHNAPAIILINDGYEKDAADALKLGAYDYFIKNDKQLDTLHKSIINAVEKYILNQKLEAQSKELEHIAYHDHLTNIPNRVLFEDLTLKALSRAKRTHSSLAILMIDLDRFKYVNDTLGHDVGDLLIKGVTERFQDILRSEDVIARMGGDEFVVMISDMNKSEYAGIVAQKMINSLEQSFLLNKHQVRVTASIGIAVYPESGKTYSDLIRHADLAMYNAKSSGKDMFAYYEKSLNQQSDRRLLLESLLRQALQKQELSLNFQPIFDIETGDINGMETLLRWNSPELGFVPPDQIISIAEDTGLIIPIGYWVIDEALRQYNAWNIKPDAGIYITINISPKQLEHKDWFQIIEQSIPDYHVDPSTIIFEITETGFIKNVESACEALKPLKKLGVKIFMDDFGTGYSALSLLRELPISGIKIDRSFVQDLEKSTSDANLVKSLLSLANNMNLESISEGIETHSQLEFIKNHSDGKSDGQGFYLSKPISADAMKTLLEEHDKIARFG